MPTGELKGATNARDFIEPTLEERYGDTDITKRTVDELIEVGQGWAKAKGSGEGASSAMGMGQITTTTMKLLKEEGVVSGEDLYTEDTQLKMIDWIIRNKRPKIKAFIEGESDDLRSAVEEFGKEWEAFVKPENREEAERILINMRGNVDAKR